MNMGHIDQGCGQLAPRRRAAASHASHYLRFLRSFTLESSLKRYRADPTGPVYSEPAAIASISGREEPLLRVALLHYSVPPVVGGVESVLAHQARLLAAAGHVVTVVAARGELSGEGIRFVTVPLADSRHPRVLEVKAALDAGRVPLDFGPLVDTLTEALREALSGCEVLLAHNVCSLNKNLALTAALHDLNGQPNFPRLILWHHDLAWTTPRYRAELH